MRFCLFERIGQWTVTGFLPRHARWFLGFSRTHEQQDRNTQRIVSDMGKLIEVLGYLREELASLHGESGEEEQGA